MQRTIIGIRGRPDSGKSTTLRLVFEQLLEVASLVWRAERRYREVVAVVDVDGVKVGIVSIGDKAELLDELLDEVVGRGCAVIVCAARQNKNGTDSKTVQVVAHREPEYSVVWIDKDQVPTDRDQANQRAASLVIRSISRAVKSAQVGLADIVLV